MALHLIPEPEEKASELLRDLAANDRGTGASFPPSQVENVVPMAPGVVIQLCLGKRRAVRYDGPHDGSLRAPVKRVPN